MIDLASVVLVERNSNRVVLHKESSGGLGEHLGRQISCSLAQQPVVVATNRHYVIWIKEIVTGVFVIQLGVHLNGRGTIGSDGIDDGPRHGSQE